MDCILTCMNCMMLLGSAKGDEFHFGFICLLYIVGLMILFAELFLPGGFLGVIGLLILFGSIFLAFWHYPDKPIYGIALLGISFVILPAMLIWILRKLTLTSSQNLEEGYTSAPESLEGFLNKEGITVTPLRPSGMAMIGKHRVDVTSENVMLEANTPVKVIKIEGCRVVVIATGDPRREE